jgi:hypothetical protein
MTTASAMDSRARRTAGRAGLKATKTRWRRDTLDNFGEFRLHDTTVNCVVAGDRYDLTAEDVIAFCSELTGTAGGSK